MKILGVSASPRKKESQTLSLLKAALTAAEKDGASTELIQLPDLKIEFCLACDHCHKEKGCVIDDDVFGLLDKFLASDGFILATPVYIRQVTASLKAVMDRSSHFIHCQRLLGKYAAGIVTSGGGRGEEVLDYIKNYVITCGAQYTGGISARAPVNREAKEDVENLAKDIIQAIKEKRKYPDQIALTEDFRNYFRNLMEARKDDWCQEYDYWQKKGWI